MRTRKRASTLTFRGSSWTMVGLSLNGHPEEIDWDPDDLDGPDVHQECIDDFPADDLSFAKTASLINAWIARYKTDKPTKPRDCSNLKPQDRTLDCALGTPKDTSGSRLTFESR